MCSIITVHPCASFKLPPAEHQESKTSIKCLFHTTKHMFLKHLKSQGWPHLPSIKRAFLSQHGQKIRVHGHGHLRVIGHISTKWQNNAMAKDLLNNLPHMNAPPFYNIFFQADGRQQVLSFETMDPMWSLDEMKLAVTELKKRRKQMTILVWYANFLHHAPEKNLCAWPELVNHVFFHREPAYSWHIFFHMLAEKNISSVGNRFLARLEFPIIVQKVCIFSSASYRAYSGTASV